MVNHKYAMRYSFVLYALCCVRTTHAFVRCPLTHPRKLTPTRVHLQPTKQPPLRPEESDGHKEDKKLLAGLPLPIFFSITTIYFIQGALTLSRLATTYILKDEFHLDASTLAALAGIISIPWTIKPLYGFLTDNVPLFDYRRKSYLFLASCAASAAQFSVSQATIVADVPSLIAAVTMSSLSIAITDVVADSIVVERSRSNSDDQAGNLQSLCWISSSIGAIIAAFFSGQLIEILGPRGVFEVSSFLPLGVFLSALFVDEEPVSKRKSSTIANEANDDEVTQFTLLKKALISPAIISPMLWIFLWQSTPSSDSAFFFYLTNTLFFSPDTLGKVKLVTAISGLVGILIYRQFLRAVDIKKLLKFCGFAAFPLSLSPLILISHLNQTLGIPDKLFVFGDDAVITVLAELAFLPILVLASSLCPPGIEGSLFATMMSIFNFAGVVGNEFGALLTKTIGYTGAVGESTRPLEMLIVLCSLINLIPVFFIDKLVGGGVGGSNRPKE